MLLRDARSSIATCLGIAKTFEAYFSSCDSLREVSNPIMKFG